MNKLMEICAKRREAVEAAKAAQPAAELRARIADLPPARGFRAALAKPGLSVIAEVKRKAPSAGALQLAADASLVAKRYARAGAAAISVLTEPDYFGGDLQDMIDVRVMVPVPVLRKDFTVDPYQLLESRAAGADAVLLIVAALGEATGDYLAQARDLGLDALVEVHDEAELEIAAAAGADILGINNRDLKTLSVELAVTERLAPAAPETAVLVGESGVETGADAGRMVAAGMDAILVGSALMRAADPEAKLAELIGCRTSRSVA